MILYILLAAFCGLIVGAVGHAFVEKESAVAEKELVAWSTRLRNAAQADAAFAKNEMIGLAKEIEAKL